jgi:CheY-like chemotaxis protein
MAVVVAADDDNDIRALMVMVLERAGHEVVAFANGRDALAAVRDRLPDVVVLDHHMPLLTGGEVRRALHDDPLTADIPVLMASAGLDAADEVASWETTVVLRKPYLPTDLVVAVESLLRETAAIESLLPGVAGVEPLLPEAAGVGAGLG